MVPSGSCTAMVTHHFADLFQKEPETLARVHAMEKKVYEFATFLTEVAGVEDVGARMEDVVTFHDGCHALRELGIKSAPRRLLARVKGLELREMELSGAMARTKIEAIMGTGANTVVSLDPSCLMQIQGALSRAGLHVRTMHLAEVLASR